MVDENLEGPEEPEIPEEETGAPQIGDKIRGAAEKVSQKGKEAAKKPIKGGLKEGAKKSLDAFKGLASKIGTQVLSKLGLTIAASSIVPTVLGIIIIAVGVIIAMVIIVIFVNWISGGAGKALKSESDPSNPEQKVVFAKMEELIQTGKIEAPDDKSYLPEGEPTEKDYLLGAESPKAGRIDFRLLKALIYLGEKHDYIYVRNIIYPYVYMPVDTIETKSTKDKQLLKNISAHKSGQAADITKIDYIYKQWWGCCDEKCEKDNISYYYKSKSQPKLICIDPCLGDKGQECANNTAQCRKNGNCTELIKVQVDWQDEPLFSGALNRGVSSSSIVQNVLDSLGITEGSFEGENFIKNLENTGRAELERFLKLDPGSLEGKDLTNVTEKMGREYLRNKLGIPEGGFEGFDLAEIARDSGQAQIEKILNLPNESWEGTNLKSLAKNMAVTRIERELGMPEGMIKRKNPSEIARFLNRKQIKDEDLKQVGRNMGLKENQINKVVAIINKAKSGKNQAEAAIEVGESLLDIALGFPQDLEISKNMADNPNEINFELPDVYQNQQAKFNSILREKEIENNLPEGSLNDLLNIFKRGQNPQDWTLKIGSDLISQKIGLKPEAILSLIKNQKTLDQIFREAGTNEFEIAGILGVSEDSIKELLTPGKEIKRVFNQSGALYMSLSLGTSYENTTKLINKEMGPLDFLKAENTKFKDLAQKWDVTEKSIEHFLSNDPEKAYREMGANIFQKHFDINNKEINDALARFTAGEDPEKIAKDLAQKWLKNKVFNVIESSLEIDKGTIAKTITGTANPNELKSGFENKNWAGLAGDVFGSCIYFHHRPVAQEKVHQVIKQLLQMPSANEPKLNLPDLFNMRVTQLITFSNERDVLPFETGEEKPTLDGVYGKNRLPNYGLFQMNEARDHIHIGF